MPKKFIVKVQLSLMTSHEKPMVIVYDEKRTFTDQHEASQEIIDMMDGEPKKFFWAKKLQTDF